MTEKVPQPWSIDNHGLTLAYITEASDLGFPAGIVPNGFECPSCKKKIHGVMRHHDQMNETLYWDIVCKCGAHLKVFND